MTLSPSHQPLGRIPISIRPNCIRGWSIPMIQLPGVTSWLRWHHVISAYHSNHGCEEIGMPKCQYILLPKMPAYMLNHCKLKTTSLNLRKIPSLTFNFISTCFFNSKGVHKSFSKSTRKDNETLLDGQMISWWNLKNSMSEMPLLSDQTLEGKV